MELKIDRKSNHQWWRSAVIYQVYPRSFFDTNGDGIGDLQGIIKKLDYIASLGVDAVWISPFYQSPMKDFGYDISDYRAVDPIFGTIEDFKELVAAAKERNLKILLDQVWNHTSDQHPWFKESRQSRDNPKADWYVWEDAQEDGTPPNNWLATFGGSAWAWDAQRQQYYLHNFLIEQPDLNWYNPEVKAAIFDVAKFWLDLGVDGFRLDVVNFFFYDPDLKDNPCRPQDVPLPDGAGENDPFFSQLNLHNLSQPQIFPLLEDIRQLMDSYPDTTTLAEISSTEDGLLTASRYVSGNKRLHMAYNSSLMNDEPLSYDKMHRLITRVEKLFADGVICWTAGTHDFPRLKSRWHKYQIDDQFINEAFDHMFAALIIALRGSCCLYQGDELGLTQAHIPFEKMQDPFGIAGYPSILGRDGSRTPMPWFKEDYNAGFSTAKEPWLPIPDEHRRYAVDTQEPNPNSLLHKYRRLIHWRKQQPALLWGDLTLLDTPEPLLGFTRECPEQKMLCLFNLDTLPVRYDLSPHPSCVDANEVDFNNRRYENIVEISGYGVFFGHYQ